MISTVALLGRTCDLIPGHPDFRMIQIDSMEAFHEDTFVSYIPAKYWVRDDPDNAFTRIPNGHFVVIFGRLESHPELGLYVLVEQVRHFSSNLLTSLKEKEEEK